MRRELYGIVFLLLLAIFGLFGCSQDKNKSQQMTKEYVFWLKLKEGVQPSSWKCYRTTSEEGLEAVQGWINHNKHLLDAPIIAVFPEKVLDYNEGGVTKKSYALLELYPKDSSPLLEREFIEHIPKSEIQRLIQIFEEHGESEQKANAEILAEAVSTKASVMIEARIVKDHGGGKYYYYDIKVMKVVKNSIAANLDSPMKVARVNYEAQPELNKTYVLELDYYNKAHPEYGLKITGFKEK